MSMISSRRPSRARVGDFRARQRAKGLKLVQYWVPDVESEEFRAEAHRQSLLIAGSPFEADDQAFVDSISMFPDELDDEARTDDGNQA